MDFDLGIKNGERPVTLIARFNSKRAPFRGPIIGQNEHAQTENNPEGQAPMVTKEGSVDAGNSTRIVNEGNSFRDPTQDVGLEGSTNIEMLATIP